MIRKLKTGFILILFALAGKSFSQCAKFEPPNGKILFFLGQDMDAVGGLGAPYDKGYLDQISSDTPAGITIYTSIPNLEGLTGISTYMNDVTSGTCGDCFVKNTKFDNSALAIGLYMVDQLNNINAGKYDQKIITLANWIKSTHRPVFLRIGYEYDGNWNHYDPTQYKLAFQRIVNKFRELQVSNCAFVWQSSGYNSNESSLLQWYPGDAYVDWIGYSHFVTWSGTADLSIAKKKKKPLMIAESAPYSVRVGGVDGNNLWTSWYKPLFDRIHANPEIKLLAYINQDWDKQAMWAGQNWGNSRVQDDPVIKSKWLSEMGSSIWLQAKHNSFQGNTCDSLRVNAGPAATFYLPPDTFQLKGSVYGGNPPYTYSWNTISGAGAQITNGNTLSPTIKGVTTGDYVFVLSASDVSGKIAKDTVRIKVTANPVKYFGTAPAAIPGKVEAENYDIGGQDMSYYDVTTYNQGTSNYRGNDFVDLATTTDGGSNNIQLCYIQTGEWLKYTVDVTLSGSYLVTFRVASQVSGGYLHLEVNGKDVTGKISIPNTGSWTTWKDVVVSNVPLTKGVCQLTLVMDYIPGLNLNYMTFSPMLSAIESFNKAEVNLYPNPVSDYLMLELPEPSKVVIYSVQGREVMSEKLEGVRNVMDLKALPDGIYNINIQTATHSSNRLFIKMPKGD